MDLIEPLNYRRKTEHVFQDIVVFLDRDGTLTKEKGIINHPENIELEPTSSRAIRCLNKLQIPVIVLTNQPGIQRGLITKEILLQTHTKLNELLYKADAFLNGIYVCPHLPQDKTKQACSCHKPSIGLATKAIKELKLKAKRIYVVGDRITDIYLAKNLEGIGILVKTGYGQGELENNQNYFIDKPNYIAENIEDAIRWILITEFEKNKDVRRLPIPHYQWPDINNKTAQAVQEQLYSTISLDNNTGIIREFEQEWCKLTKRNFAVTFNSGTMALYAAYRSLGIVMGDEVILPAYGFFATASPLITIGAIPVFVDVDDTGNLDPEKVESKISRKTRAIVVSHIYGIPANMSKISEIAVQYCLPIIEDASHAYGACQAEFKVGKFGVISVFSLQSNKLISAGEGGVLLTDDKRIFFRATLEGHFNKRNLSAIPDKDELFKFFETGSGLKLRLHPLAAAIGLDSLRRVSELLQLREECYKEMTKVINSSQEISIVKPDYEASLSYYSFPLLLPKDMIGRKNQILTELYDEGYTSFFNSSSTGVIPFLPLFRNPNVLLPNFPKNRILKDDNSFIKAVKFNERLVLLPLWHRKVELPIAISYSKALEFKVSSLKCSLIKVPSKQKREAN
jgi:perosamine synthetase